MDFIWECIVIAIKAALGSLFISVGAWLFFAIISAIIALYEMRNQ